MLTIGGCLSVLKSIRSTRYAKDAELDIYLHVTINGIVNGVQGND